MPVAVAEPTDNLTTKAVLSMDKEAKPYQVGIYTRLSFESEANKERDTVDTQIAYIREFINGQDDMVEVCVYADISVTGTTFERPEFDRMIQDIRAGKINTVITRDLSRLGRNYVEAGNYIERVFPFLDVRYIAITDDFDTARPGTDLSVPLKNIVNEYYSKDLSKKVETGKHSIWAQGGFSEGTPPYGYYRATDGSRKLLIDEEVSDNVVRIFNMFLDGEGYGSIAKTMQSEGILSPPKYRFYKAGKTEFAEKAREWHYSHVKEILQGEYYIGNIVHGKQRKALDTGRKNKKTDKSKWQRVENAHEPIIDKDTFYRVQERIELIRSKHLEGSKPNPEAPKKPDNILVYKTKCACCGGSVLIIRHESIFEKTEDEIILCLGYDGLYGVNNINRYMQKVNLSNPIEWGNWVYKVGDKVLFNDNKRFGGVLYNNLKGTIVAIDRKAEEIVFQIQIDKKISDRAIFYTDLKLHDCACEGKSIVEFSVKKRIEKDSDTDYSEQVVPFQIAYAVSIHKAQGLEYKSVKVVITEDVDEQISHNIFYTAITRTTDKLKIYLSKETQKKLATKFVESNVGLKQAQIFAQHAGLKLKNKLSS